jgi:hypothetical protein
MVLVRNHAAGYVGSDTLVVGDARVYVAPAVSAVAALWNRGGGLAGSAIREQLARFAAELTDAHAAGEVSAAVLVSNWSGGREDELRSMGMLAEPQARLIVARDHGFTAWSSVAGESRQVVPANAPEVVATLLAAGADRSAKLYAYGGEFDALAMLKTSAHPRVAGVAAALEDALSTARSRH